MKTVNNITVTDARLKKALKKQVTPMITPTVDKKIEESINKSFQFGYITKFYHYLDKAEVVLDSGETVICKILHRFGGVLMDFYTPEADSLEFDDVLKEPYYKPRGKDSCLIVNINDKDYFILGFYLDEELVQVNPAAPGNIKLIAYSGTNQFWIKFGTDGLDLRLPYDSKTNVGDRDETMHETSYANSDNVYTKQEVYTKEEVDELIAKKISEALGE